MHSHIQHVSLDVTANLSRLTSRRLCGMLRGFRSSASRARMDFTLRRWQLYFLILAGSGSVGNSSL